MLCFVVVMQSFIMNSHEVFIHIHQGCFAGTGAIVRLPQCQRSKPDGYGKISQCITTTKHSKAKTVCIFLGIYCICITKPQCVDLQVTVLYAYGIRLGHHNTCWWPSTQWCLAINRHTVVYGVRFSFIFISYQRILDALLITWTFFKIADCFYEI